CWTGQLMAQVPTASTCTSEARQAISCAAARMDSGGILSTIVKGRQCDSPPDICAPRQLSAMELLFSLASTITVIPCWRSCSAGPMPESLDRPRTDLKRPETEYVARFVSDVRRDRSRSAVRRPRTHRSRADAPVSRAQYVEPAS